MKIVLLAVLVGLVCANPDPWEMSGGSGCKSADQFKDMWHIFDINHDGAVTHLEFDTAYNRFDFDNKEQADLFFMELDRVPDEALTDDDFAHIFRLFDIDGGGCVSHQEWQRMWKALTDN